MNLGPAPRRTVVLMMVAAGLLLTGLVIDVGFTRPRAAEVRSLTARRMTLSSQMTVLAAEGSAARRLQDRLGPEARAEMPSAPGSELGWLAHEIEVAGLRRLEIVSREAGVQERFLVARYSLRASGSYRRVLELVQRLEADRRLVVIESLRLAPVGEWGELEAGLDLALVTPTSVEGTFRP